MRRQPVATDDVPVASVEAGEPQPSEDPPIAGDWSTLVRDERWDAARAALEKLPDDEKSRPELRYLRARVALALGNGGAALPLLDGLEPQLPLLAADVERRRAEAQLSVGPFAAAGEWYAARSTPSAQLAAARAFEKANDLRRARGAADRVTSSDKKTRVQEAEARAIRIRVEPAPGPSEQEDARWLATIGADTPAASDALALVARLSPTQPLTARELLVRAQTLADAGRTDEALHAIDAAAAAPGAAALAKGERTRARALALYKARGRGSEAARAFADSAAAGGPDAADDAFHAARSLSRADRDDAAIRAYEEVERKYAQSTWAPQAAYMVPYLRMLHGEWTQCAEQFADYAARFPTGDQLRDARTYGALCRLLQGDPRSARIEFERMVEEEPDPLVSARLADMAALAALRDGDRTHAVTRWTDVVRSRPLSWPALVAVAHLRDVGAPVPALLDPAEADASGGPPPLSVALPPPADLLHRLGLDQDAESEIHERESVLVSGAGARGAEALCAAYGQLDRARRRFQIAQTLPSSLFVAAPSPQTRWAWECAFPSPYADAVRGAETVEHLPAGLLWAVMRQESGFDPDAVSPARAVGLMQLLPQTARPLAEELGLAHDRDEDRLTSPTIAVRLGARALRKLLDQMHGNVPLAVAAYNAGAENVLRWISRSPGMQIDTFVERIPFKETKEYVARVMGNFAHYAYLDVGPEKIPAIELGL